MGSLAKKWGLISSRSPRPAHFTLGGVCDECKGVLDDLASNLKLGAVLCCKNIQEACANARCCAFCRILVAGLLNGRSHLPIDENTPIKITLPYRPRGLHGRLQARLEYMESRGSLITCDVGSVGHLGSELRLVTGREIDPGHIKRWMGICSENHKNCRSKSSRARGIPIRLIDVANSCLVEVASGDCRDYATLSYVWGDVPSMRLCRKTLPLLLEHRGIENRRKFIAQTILDAILLCAKLDIQYLWVDALCLVSDDENDMAYGISSMDVIYDQSTLNIIAASGFDAGAGLPGVRFGSRTPTQPQELIEGTTFVARRSVMDHLAASRYTTRGWTFQEQRLSHRSAVFVNQQLYWLCKSTEWSEDLTRDEDPEISWLPLISLVHLNELSTIHMITSGAPDDTDLWGRFHLDISEYSLRRLTHESDTLRAISAVMNHYSRELGITFLQGLCIETIDLSILFTLHRTQSGDFTSQRRPGFPSYSWVGWRNAVGSHFKVVTTTDSFGCKTLRKGFLSTYFLENDVYIMWYQVGKDGNEKRLGLSNGASGGSPSQQPPTPLRLTVGTQPVRRLATKAKGVAHERNHAVLNFIAVVVELSLQSDGFIVDNNLRRIGWASLPEGVDLTYPTSFPWIILSVGTRHSCENRDSCLSASFIKLMPEDAARILFGNPAYWVMAIETENGVSERIALGLIRQDVQFRPVPVWQELILA